MSLRPLIAPALLLALAGCTVPPPPAPPAPDGPYGPLTCVAPSRNATEVNLYYGRKRPGGLPVTDAEWRAYVDQVLIPAFPDGMTLLTGAGRSADSPPGMTGDELSMLVVLIVFDTNGLYERLEGVANEYRRRFYQQAVLSTQKPLCAEFFQRVQSPPE